MRQAGVAMATELCEKLLEAGAPGLHFYTLNRSSATREIYAALGLVGQRLGSPVMAQRITMSPDGTLAGPRRAHHPVHRG